VRAEHRVLDCELDICIRPAVSATPWHGPISHARTGVHDYGHG
jgi:hypothetical protein